jgi:hypothetical protein
VPVPLPKFFLSLSLTLTHTHTQTHTCMHVCTSTHPLSLSDGLNINVHILICHVTSTYHSKKNPAHFWGLHFQTRFKLSVHLHTLRPCWMLCNCLLQIITIYLAFFYFSLDSNNINFPFPGWEWSWHHTSEWKSFSVIILQASRKYTQNPSREAVQDITHSETIIYTAQLVPSR